ncbi:hypothetical protein RB2150_10649 [Rhodobacterales bacterium HTCC2150]|nr:hypothetical protein RB2150_10649 [Rhodobacterales bacterium HTCC2150] [Rhodobacteraceae bacterium HTCC2150]
MRLISLFLALCLCGAAQADGPCDNTTECTADSLTCTWAFPYRAKEADNKFKKTLFDIQTCLGPNAKSNKDTGVNHPDSYDLWVIESDRTTARVSLKDKAALEKTYVFLQLIPKP